MSSALDTPDHTTAVFTKRLVRWDGSQVHYLEAGGGEPVVVLARSDDPSSLPLSNLLADHFQVFVFDISQLAPPSSNEQLLLPRDLARNLARAAAAAGLKRYALISTSADVAIALWHSLDAPQQIDALVLISPALVLSDQSDAGNDYFTDPELACRLGELQAPVLLLVGTEDQAIPRETGRMYVERMPHCYYVLVYDAGQEIEAERPDALFAVVHDFLERRETFIVKRPGHSIQPVALRLSN
jgi:pimeloyl-ACP methyl ester carboxylesterase